MPVYAIVTNAAMDALYHIQHDVKVVRDAMAKPGQHDETAMADLDSALTEINDAVSEALDAYTRLPGGRR